MTDYYPLIARAVAGLAKSTGESRRTLYERARTALLAQLRNLDPPLAENEITRERLLLEEAIRKVEADAARQQRADLPRPKQGRAQRSRTPRPQGRRPRSIRARQNRPQARGKNATSRGLPAAARN